jgi:hypothetical protein
LTFCTWPVGASGLTIRCFMPGSMTEVTIAGLV